MPAEETPEAEEIAKAEETAEAMKKLRTRQFNRTFFGKGQYKTLEQPSQLKLTKKSIVSQFPSFGKDGWLKAGVVGKTRFIPILL